MSDLSSASVDAVLQGRLGRPYTFVDECPSTQRLIDENAVEGTLVATDLQTHGRGRLGRRWEAPSGTALLFSVLLRPQPPMAIWPELSLVAGDAVAAALREQTGVAAELSHPNDVFVQSRKVAGVLPEATVGRVVLGIGVNVNQSAADLPAETTKPPTSLRLETGREWPRAPLLGAILVELEHRYDEWQRLHTNR